MKYIVAFVCLVALFSQTSSQGAQAYCGRRLANTLAYLCQEVEDGAVKRSDGDISAASLYGTRSWATLGGARRKRGVVEECCYKPCMLDELLTYC